MQNRTQGNNYIYLKLLQKMYQHTVIAMPVAARCKVFPGHELNRNSRDCLPVSAGDIRTA